MHRIHLLAALLLFLLLLLSGPGHAAIRGEFEALEQQVALDPSDCISRLKLARAYAKSGFVEEASEQYFALLERHASEEEARGELDNLLAQRMPNWLPEGATRVNPFPLCTTQLLGEGGRLEHSFLITTAGFAAHEGERQERTHGWRFGRVAYGYVLDPRRGRWLLEVRVHSAEAQAALAQDSLKLVLALYGVVRTNLGYDPTAHGRPLDIWVCEDGPPGAHAIGNSIYLYAVKTPRAPVEWVRELSHEYGHLALPGIGGFTQTDDAWADGDLGELLFVEWLAGSKSEWLPWSVPEAEQIAAAERRALVEKAPKPSPKLLDGKDEKARDHLLGLALRVEEKLGAQGLAEVLNGIPHGNARQFAAAAERVARERGVKIW